MMIVDRIQKLITEMESTAGRRLLWAFACCLALAGLVIWYDIWSYRGFSAPEAMDTAQVARNLADGHGYATQCIVPLRFYLMKSKGQAVMETQTALGQHGGYYADLGNPPVYPTVLAGLMKLAKPKRQVE